MTKRGALITGGARRIGRRLALGFAEAGYAVGIHCWHSQREAQTLCEEIRNDGGAAELFTADLTKEEAPDALIEEASAKLEGLSCLVNNASLFEKDAFGALDFDLWERHIHTNLRAPLFLSQSFAKRIGQEPANIINILDEKVWRLNPSFFSYTLSKSALWTATQLMAQALAPHIRVNGVGPGPVLPASDMTDQSFARMAEATPLGKSVSPDDIWRAVRFIIETPSLTGQMIAVDSGQHLAWQTPDIGDDVS